MVYIELLLQDHLLCYKFHLDKEFQLLLQQVNKIQLDKQLVLYYQLVSNIL